MTTTTSTLAGGATDWTPPAPGPWQQDSAHTPVSQTAVMQTVYPEGFNRGFTETFARYGVLLDRLAMASVNGFTYHQPQPFDLPGPDGPLAPEQVGAEIGRRAGIAAEAFASRQWLADLRDWDTAWKPAATTRHRELGSVDLAGLDRTGLIAHLRTAARHTSEMVYQHHRFNMAAMLPVGDFALQVARRLGTDPRAVLAALDGYSPISNVAADELGPALAAIRADDAARALVVGGGDPEERLNALRARCPELEDHLAVAGARLVDGFDVTGPTLLERPELLLGRLAAALDADPAEAKRRSDEFAAGLRERLAPEDRALFDELLADARAVYRLRDERGVYSDVTAIGLLRLAMLEAGRRLAAAGHLPEADLALDATIEELVELLEGTATVDAEVLAERRDTRVALTSAGAPRYLGPPPPAPPPVEELPPPLDRLMAAVGFCIEGILGQLEEPGGDGSTVAGIAAGPGCLEGTARVVRSIDELVRIEPGDILVTPSTSEAFTSMLHLVHGIVTDHGSFVCHAAIVGREMGLPVVAGTVDGTSRIPDGATIRIDGDRGQVTILS